MVSHASAPVVGFTDAVFRAGGSMPTVMESLSRVFTVSLAKGQGNVSGDLADVMLGCAVTDEFKGNLETKLWIKGGLSGVMGEGLGCTEMLYDDKLSKKSVVPWVLFDGSQKEKFLVLGLEVSVSSLSEFKFASLSKGTDSFFSVFKPFAMLCVLFFSRTSPPWLPNSSKLNKIEINRILAEVSMVAFFGFDVIKGNLQVPRLFTNRN